MEGSNSAVTLGQVVEANLAARLLVSISQIKESTVIDELGISEAWPWARLWEPMLLQGS